MSINLIPSWSFSTWSSFQKCKHRVYLDKVVKAKKIPIESTEDKEHPLLRGTRIHEAAELYIKENVELIPELAKYFKSEFAHLKELYAQNIVEIEQPWAFTENWAVTNWSSNDAWVRAKLDALIKIHNTTAVVIDYKTGKSFGNEVSHSLQGQIYAIMTFLRYPILEHVVIEFWYLDQNEITTVTYHREKALNFLLTWTQRGKAITNEIEFKANPSNSACKYCPFGAENGTGVCEYKI